MTVFTSGFDGLDIRPGDVLMWGLCDGAAETRVASDLITCFNAFGLIAFTERFVGLNAAWASHCGVALDAETMAQCGGHRRGPGWTISVTAESIREYGAGRMLTVIRSPDPAHAAAIVRIARALIDLPGRPLWLTSAGVLRLFTLQAVFAGTRNGEVMQSVRTALEENRRWSSVTRDLPLCGSFVAALAIEAAHQIGRTELVRGVWADGTPQDLMAQLMAHGAWTVEGAVTPAGIEAEVPRPGQRCLPATERPWPVVFLGLVGRWRPLAATVGVVICTAALFAAGLGPWLRRKAVAHTRPAGASGGRRSSLGLAHLAG